jgi:hypothetical protein
LKKSQAKESSNRSRQQKDRVARQGLTDEKRNEYALIALVIIAGISLIYLILRYF